MAVTLEQIKRLTIIAETKGVDQVRAELERLAAAQKSTGQASESAANKFNNLERSLFPLLKAQQQLEAATRQAATAALQDASKIERAAQVLVAAQQRYAEAAIKAKTAGEAQAEAAERQRKAFVEEGIAVRKAAEAQEFYNRTLGVSGGNTNGADIANQMRQRIADTEEEIKKREQLTIQSAERIATAQARIANPFRSSLSGKSAADSASVFSEGFEADAKRLSAMRARYDEAYKAGQNYAKAVKEINELHKAGQISAEKRVELLKYEQIEYRRIMQQELGGGRERGLGALPGNRLALHQARNLGFQVNDILTGAFSGQSPMMILAQQGGQIYQILSDGPGGVGGAVKRLGGYLKDLLTPVRLATLGFVGFGIAALAAINDAQNRLVMLGQALNGLGAASGLNASGLNAIAQRAASSSSTTSIYQAQQQAAAFARTGMSAEGITGLTGGTVDTFSKAFGVSIEEATKTLAAAFADPAKGAKDLGRIFGTINDAQMESIRRIQETGDVQRAQKMLLDALNMAMRDVTPMVTSLGHATELVKKAFSDLWTRFGEAAAGGAAKMLGIRDPRAEEEEVRRKVAEGKRLGLDNAEDSWLSKKLGIGMVAEYQAAVAKLAEIEKKAGEKRISDEKKQQEVLATQRANAAAEYIREVTTIEQQRLEILKKIAAIQAADPTKMDAGSAARSAEAIERFNSSLRTLITPMQQIQLTSALQIQQTLAETAAQRAAVEAQRAYIEALRSNKTEAEAVAAAEAAVNQARAEGLRQVRDAQREASNRLATSNMLPGEKSIAEIFLRFEELARQTNVGATADLPKVFVPFNQGLNAATEAVKSFAAALAAATPGGVGSALGRSASIPDTAWYAQLKSTDRVTPSTPIPNPFGDTLHGPGGVLGTLPNDLSFSFKNLEQAIKESTTATRLSGGRPQPTVTPNPQGGMAVNPAAITTGIQKALGDTLTADQNEKFVRIIKAANQEIGFQNNLLNVQIATFGQSHAAVAEATKLQELKNQAERDGLTLTPQVIAGMEQVAAKAGEQAERIARLKDALQTLNDLRSGFSDAFSTFVGGLARGDKMSKILENTINSLTSSLLRMATNLMMKGLFGDSNFTGGLLGPLLRMFMPSANGNVFSGGRMLAFANGGVVGGPTTFPMRGGGIGLMGEAGPEAIMPLRRGPDGKLGVAAQTKGQSGGVSIVVNNHSSAKVETSNERGPDGREMIRMMIREEVGGGIANGDYNGAFRGQYGMAPRKFKPG